MILRYHIEVKGVVQGVGFRPFVYNLAEQAHLTGWVYNHAQGVSIEIEGEQADCAVFLAELEQRPPALAVVEQVEARGIPLTEEPGFVIRSSVAGERDTLISPDMGVCADCLADLNDPHDRRYHYAFTNCTNCGPRFTIIADVPYDRPNTTMRDFPLCPDCALEYQDPHDRRFHAQPVACPACGPRLAFLDQFGQELAGDPLTLAHAALEQGRIIAVKGLGGYHLVCDAENPQAVLALRQRKYRWDKPFAVMLADVETARRFCQVSPAEEKLLTSQRRPIVLLEKRRGELGLAEQIAPGNRALGVMLPYTPLHYLLMAGHTALVMTSGNISDEPILFQDQAAIRGLAAIADGFLTHDRAIFRRCDDSVAQVAAGAPRLLRRARGWSPQPLPLPQAGACPAILACGPEQKNTFCLTRRQQAFVSQHIGDLNDLATYAGYQREIEQFVRLFNSQPQIIAYDLHPEYLSGKFAREYPGPVQKTAVQHHHAHLASVLAEHDWPGPALGLIFDGTGLGEDGVLWGGELLAGDAASYQRLGHLRELRLPGGEQAVREPWRVALAALDQVCGNDQAALTAAAPAGLLQPGWQTLLRAAALGVNAPRSTGMGRLFDAVAALAGVGRTVNYEGQAAVELEQLLDEEATGAYQFALAQSPADGLVMDWRPVVAAAAADSRAGLGAGLISARFHRGLRDLCLEVCVGLRQQTGLTCVALSGGCWQNLWLLEQVTAALTKAGFTVLTNRAVPVNDGGVAFGQAAVAAARWKRGEI